jgi:CubicO group peptidase (beta-lactamase class C family)
MFRRTRPSILKRRLAIVSLFVLSVLVVAPLRGEDQFEPVRQRIAKALTDTNVPSIAVAVAREGMIVWEQGFGWADRENRVPASEHTLYSLASISKPITATGLMVLKERGKLDLDKPANDYLGDVKLRVRVGDPAEATLRRVANHTAGLPLHYQFFYADESYRAPARDETIRRYGNLVTAPGERFQYSNLGYGVLDYVIERAGGRKFADVMREEVFLPLGMTHTSVDVGPGLEPHQAIRYTPEGRRIPFYDFDHPGASAVFASAHDLVRFAMFHMKEHLADQRPILSDAAIDEMQVATAHSPGGGGYGVGWGVNDANRGYHSIQHSGGMPGVSTLCSFVPSQRVAVVVLCNTGSPLVGYLNDMIYKIVLPERKAEGGSSTKGSPDSASNEPPPRSQLLGRWKGSLSTYKNDVPLVLSIKALDDARVKLGKQLETLLSDATYSGGYLRGRFAGEIDYDDARGRGYQLQLELKLRDGVLNGPLIVTTLPDGRGSSATSHWVNLKRESGPSESQPATTAPAGG